MYLIVTPLTCDRRRCIAVVPYWSRLLQALNILLRFAWMQTVLNFKVSFTEKH
ncbi:Phosphate transporter PHO1 -like protein [Gossypium arboreum]|uniref:Phosphate transporter PHO1-like protein n=1 Tax=Gossypium arboreum TaxID=29729 RepID=A0A0B0PGM7_GOSAR|nr:Phosphate transporter PHO1 -like protein [Gossypium arboreum]